MLLSEVKNYKLMAVLPKHVVQSILSLVETNPSRADAIRDILGCLEGVDLEKANHNAFMQISKEAGESFIETYSYVKSENGHCCFFELKIIVSNFYDIVIQQTKTPFGDKKMAHKPEVIELALNIENNECCYTNSKTGRTSNFKMVKTQLDWANEGCEKD